MLFSFITNNFFINRVPPLLTSKRSSEMRPTPPLLPLPHLLHANFFPLAKVRLGAIFLNTFLEETD